MVGQRLRSGWIVALALLGAMTGARGEIRWNGDPATLDALPLIEDGSASPWTAEAIPPDHETSWFVSALGPQQGRTLADWEADLEDIRRRRAPDIPADEFVDRLREVIAAEDLFTTPKVSMEGMTGSIDNPFVVPYGKRGPGNLVLFNAGLWEGAGSRWSSLGAGPGGWVSLEDGVGPVSLDLLDYRPAGMRRDAWDAFRSAMGHLPGTSPVARGAAGWDLFDQQWAGFGQEEPGALGTLDAWSWDGLARDGATPLSRVFEGGVEAENGYRRWTGARDTYGGEGDPERWIEYGAARRPEGTGVTDWVYYDLHGVGEFPDADGNMVRREWWADSSRYTEVDENGRGIAPVFENVRWDDPAGPGGDPGGVPQDEIPPRTSVIPAEMPSGQVQALSTPTA